MINHVNILSNLSLVFPQFPFLMSAIILVFDYNCFGCVCGILLFFTKHFATFCLYEKCYTNKVRWMIDLVVDN